jgi:hypothetical protein
MLAAFPEKRRLLFVRLPRSAGQATVDHLEGLHPVPPAFIGGRDYRDAAVFMPLIGACANRFDITTTLAVCASRMATFVTPGGLASDQNDDGLQWRGVEPVFRPGDLMFAILRPPRDVALSQVNAALAALGSDEASVARPLRQRFGRPPPAGKATAWRALGREMLGEVVARNPVCHALGDGTAAGALAACRCVPIQLVGLGRYEAWARVAIGPWEAPRQIGGEAMLRREDVAADVLTELVAEDEVFYGRFEAAMAGNAVPYVLGTAL